MVKLLAALILGPALFAQTAVFPGSVASDQNLMIGVNNVATTLAAAQGVADTSMTVANSLNFRANMLVSVGSGGTTPEIEVVCSVSGNVVQIGYLGSCPSGTGRGFDNTTPANHPKGAVVSALIDAWHHNALSKEVQAVEGYLHGIGTGPVTSVFGRTGGVAAQSGDYTDLLISPTPKAVTFSSSPTFDLSTGTFQTLTLTGDALFPVLVNGVPGKTYVFKICQDGTGNHQFQWPAGLTGTMTVGLTPSTCSVQQLVAVGSSTLSAVAPGIINQ
jgi:hypothetical protein